MSYSLILHLNTTLFILCNYYNAALVKTKKNPDAFDVQKIKGNNMNLLQTHCLVLCWTDSETTLYYICSE